MRGFFNFVLISIAIFNWFFFKEALANYFSLFIVFYVVLSCVLNIFINGRNAVRVLFLLLSSIVMISMIFLLHSVNGMADDYFKEFKSKNTCMPSVVELKKDGTWEVGPVMSRKIIYRFGAVRRFLYQNDTGLLRYGFFNLNGRNAIIFKPCGVTQSQKN